MNLLPFWIETKPFPQHSDIIKKCILEFKLYFVQLSSHRLNLKVIELRRKGWGDVHTLFCGALDQHNNIDFKQEWTFSGKGWSPVLEGNAWFICCLSLNVYVKLDLTSHEPESL